MRLRRTVAASFTALSLTAVLASPAHAATGDFHYQFVGFSGDRQSATLTDPASGECVTIPEAADPGSTDPAFAPHNDTDEYAVVFTGADCTGDPWTLRPHGQPATDRLVLRSVVFLAG
ncbi:hypothetical protein ACQKM2_35830 [Streptomyces sp. NPDC004126]|uniref:hypothetical protein n=1 Tax=Streptomyces sp. NPDC004126 TaxID=3390695 RepID=UPI003D021419